MKKTATQFGMFLIGFSLLLAACGTTASKQSMATIEGVITDQFSEAPLEGVNISLQGTQFSTQTDSDGYFSFNDLEEGSYTVVVEKEGYEPKNTSVSVTVGSSSTVSVSTKMVLRWDYEVTDRNHTIGILANGTFDINGSGLQNGDIIGVFYLKDGAYQAGGRIQRPWDGSSTAIAAYGDDTFTEDTKDGFEDGEPFVWVLRRNNGSIFRLTATYEAGNNTFQTNGISKVIGLTAE
jgi:hypothetical protein